MSHYKVTPTEDFVDIDGDIPEKGCRPKTAYAGVVRRCADVFWGLFPIRSKLGA